MAKNEVYKITQDSLRVLFELYFDSLCQYLSYYSHNTAAIEEVVQEVFVHVWEERENLEIEHVKTYLFTSARYRMFNYIRNTHLQKEKLAVWQEEEKQKIHSKEIIDMEEFSSFMQTAVEELPLKCREVFELNRENKLTYKQIAELKGISVKTVETQMSIALQKIKTTLALRYKYRKN